jgi:hypothetical protein
VSRFPIVLVDACPLCGSPGPLRESHIIPRFVFEWLLESSATGHMRMGQAPSLRVQDGFKPRLLCEPCEQRLGVWENQTAQHLFRPYHLNTSLAVSYDSWLAKFCASVCWRALFMFRGLGLDRFSPVQHGLADAALATWRTVMFDTTPRCQEFELHLLPVDVISKFQGFDAPPNINRYLARAVEIDVPDNAEAAFVYAKMCKIIVLGFVQMAEPSRWHGTRVEMGRGTIGPGHRGAPSAFFTYLMDRARRMASLRAAISERQRERITDSWRGNIERAAASESFAAMTQDVSIFGDAAFERTTEG